MKYYVRYRGQEEGPFTEDELRELLGSLKIGRKTPCRPADSNDRRMRPLEQVAPEVVGAIQRQRRESNPTRYEKERRERVEQASEEDIEALASDLIVTTETAFSELQITERLDIITAEVAIGLNVFKDAFTVARDVVGGRSKTIQNAFSEARTTVLTDLKRQALDLDADAIVGVDFKYNEISSGRSMLLLAGVGTAVTLAKQSSHESK